MTATLTDVRPANDHVPVEHRWLGLDRRTIPLALVVLGLMLVFMVVIPAVNDAVDWDDDVRAGDVLDLGTGVTFAPPTGWGLTDGIRTTDEPISGIAGEGTASVGNGGVTVTVLRAEFEGSPTDLLEQVNRTRETSDAEPNRTFTVTGPRQTVTTASGISGVSEPYTTSNTEGHIIALTLEAGSGRDKLPTGVTITVDADDQTYAANAEQIEALINSLNYEEPTP